MLDTETRLTGRLVLVPRRSARIIFPYPDTYPDDVANNVNVLPHATSDILDKGEVIPLVAETPSLGVAKVVTTAYAELLFKRYITCCSPQKILFTLP